MYPPRQLLQDRKLNAKALATFVTPVMLLLLCPRAFGQAVGDIAPYSAIENHGFDSINLQNLDVYLNMGIRKKSGPIPFSYSLTQTSHCTHGLPHSTISCGGFPANSVNAGLGGYLYTYQLSSGFCPDGTVSGESKNFSVNAGFSGLTGGTPHPLPISDVWFSGGDCNSTSLNDAAIDGSGLALSFSTSGAAVYSKSGYHATPSGYNTLITSTTDPNGNVFNVTGNSPYTYTDTLGTTALTVQQLGSDGTGGTYTWTDNNGHSHTISATPTPTTVKTAFGCTGFVDGTTSEYLVTQLSYPDNSNITLGYEPTLGGGGYTGRIASITLRTGGTIQYQYSGGNNGLNCVYFVPPVMTRTTQDGTTTYSWAAIPGGPNGSALGNTTTVIDPGGNKTVYTFSFKQTPNDPNALTQVQTYQNIGTVSQPSYVLLATDVICYNGNTVNCTLTSVSNPITEKDVYRTINGMTTSFRTQTTFDKYGSITSVAQYDFGATAITFQTSTQYGTWNGSSCVAIGNFILDRPCDVKTTDGTNTLSETRFSYDSKGNQLTKSVWTGSAWLTSSATYNSNGTKATSTDVNGQVATYSYAATGSGGCNGLLLTGTSTVVSSGDTLTTSQTWDCNGPVVLTSTDANGNTTTYSYTDPLYRMTSVTDPLGYNQTYSYTPTSITSQASFGSSINQTTSYLDGLGRPILTQHQQGPGSSSYDTTSNSYGWNGPNFQTGSSMPCVQPKNTGCLLYFSFATIDPFVRPLLNQDAGGGTVTKAYTQNDLETTLGPAPSGENAKGVQTEYDGLGRLKSTCGILSSGGTSCGQNTAASGFLTSYTYPTFAGGTKRVVTRGVQTRTFQYDALKRLTSENNPESGISSRAYDNESSCGGSGTYTSSGDLLATTDARGITVCDYYDLLHRLTDVTNSISSAANPCKRFRYDNNTGVLGAMPSGVSVSNNMGRMVEAETDNCSSPITRSSVLTDEWFSYDKDGRLTDVYELTLHSGGYYHTTVAYAPNGALQTLGGLPALATTTYGLDGEGRLSSAVQGSSNIVSSATYNAAGQPLTIAIASGAGDNDTYAYDPATGRMSKYTFTVNSISDSGSLSWNANGTLAQLAITDGFNSGGTQTCNYSYDDIGRLITDNCGSVWAQTFAYDQYDNLTKSGSITWNPGYNASHNQYTLTGTSYDAAGNVLKDTFHTYTWDAYGHPSTIDSTACGSNGTCLTYDAMGRIVEKSVGSTFSEVLYSPIGKTAVMSGQTVSRAYIPLPGRATMFQNSGNKHFYHKDWLGSVRLATAWNRAPVLDRAFAPYGEAYENFGELAEYDFTGDTQDAQTSNNGNAGLYDTPNRELQPTEGRWISPDPAGQAWNLYAYPTDPNTKTDPTGLWGGADPGDDYDMYQDPSFLQFAAMSQELANTVHPSLGRKNWDAELRNSDSPDPVAYWLFAVRMANNKSDKSGSDDPQSPMKDQAQSDKKNDGKTDTGLRVSPTPDIIDIASMVKSILGFFGIHFASATTSASADVPMEIPLPVNLLWIDKIVNGHGWDDHGQYEFDSKEEYKQTVVDTVQNAKGGDIVRNPDGRKGVTGFWNDEEGFVVWRDKSHPDQGTAFHPDNPDEYKEEWGFE